MVDLDDRRFKLLQEGAQKLDLNERLTQCSCGTYLRHPDGEPVLLPPDADPVVLAIGVLRCDACAGTAYDVLSSARRGEMVGETRRRVGPLPRALLEQWFASGRLNY